MGHDLTRMLLAGMPCDWTTTERLVALVIADHCSDRTHGGYVSNEQLCQESGLGVQGIRRALASLALRGYEFRVIVTTGSDGRRVYTNRGRATDYRVPIIRPRPKAIGSDRLTDPKGNQSRPKGNQSRPERRARLIAPTPDNPPTPKRSGVAVITPTGGSAEPDLGGAPRLPIERQAWIAIRERTCSDQTTSTPQTSTTITPGRSSGSAASSTPAA